MFQVSYFHAENEFDKLRMSRAVPWVSTPSDIVSASIESAKRKSFFILKQIGPTSFILRDGASKREQQAEGNGGSSSKNESTPPE